jgi:hypothetical protein
MRETWKQAYWCLRYDGVFRAKACARVAYHLLPPGSQRQQLLRALRIVSLSRAEAVAGARSNA